MIKPNVEPTVQLLEEMAVTLKKTARILEMKAQSIVETGDLDYASDALNTIVNLLPALRIDLLAARPIRAFQQVLVQTETEAEKV